ncbi:beta/gamma crystallin domain-containing protein [Streptomyces cavernae]|uniref:beta/gamma crystallin domain-containing protein n=1 Tax=Streptomyces cavernae TaxID=2259034 RepID=UPI001391F8D7|nr:beta/gamma crystallin domain-containing protein [Streptomyces cavernae]
MKAALRKLLTVGTITLAAFSLATPPASAINRVDCAGRNDFALFSTGGFGQTPTYVCFANGGDVDVALYGITHVRSGDNKISYLYQKTQGGELAWRTLGKWQVWEVFSEGGVNAVPTHKVLHIIIH